MISSVGIAGACLASALGVTAHTYQAIFPQSHLSKQYSQEFSEASSVLKHYGGNGPWSQGVGFGIERDTPEACTVDQVVMIHRHGERYPESGERRTMLSSLDKLYKSNVTTFKGDLAFLNDWTSYLDDECLSGQESFTGPYAGLLSTYALGIDYRSRYGHLWNGSVLPFWTSGYERVIESARHFGQGFFTTNYTHSAALNIISESEKMGANSLTPSCYTDNDTSICNNLSYSKFGQFKLAAARFNAQNPGLKLDANDIINLMDMASYELNVRPFSSWIGAFTLDEWIAFGYTRDLDYYYCAGPGDKNMNAVGAVFLNATLALLNEGPSSLPISWNFAHDTNITPIIGLLGIFNPPKDLPLDHVPFPNTWSTGNIVPQSGHLTIERLACNSTAISPAGTYVRLVVNEAVIPWQFNQSGPGYSAPLDVFTNITTQNLPNFNTQCGVPSKYPQYFDLWWNYNTSSALNYQQGPVSCAQTTTEV